MAFYSVGTLVGALSGSVAASLHIPILYQFLAISVVFILLVCMVYRFLPHGTGKKEKSWNKRREKHTTLRMEKKVLLIGLFVLGWKSVIILSITGGRLLGNSSSGKKRNSFDSV